MNYLQNILNNHSSYCQLAVFLFFFIVSWNIENTAGVIFKYKKWKHALLNFPFSLTNLPAQIILGIAFIKTIQWTTVHQIGFLYMLPKTWNPFVLFLISFILLDLGEYVYHVIMHKTKTLWRFHLVHHSDDIVDVSTTFREHPGENIVRLLFTLTWVFLTGTLFWMLILRQVIQAATTLFAHIDYRLPEKVDRVVGLLFITPNLHQVHHHYKQPYTDSNYGDVLSIWDRLFGTLQKLEADELIFGIDSYKGKENLESFPGLVALPFGKLKKSSKKNISFSYSKSLQLESKSIFTPLRLKTTK